MKTNTVWKSFIDESQTLVLSHRYQNNVYYHLILTISEAVLSEHLKDICVQEIHPFLEMIADEHISINTIETGLENALQKVNHAFSLFAEETDAKEEIKINWAFVLSYQGNILVSLIGESSILITRRWKVIYQMTNSDPSKRRSISNFTDYISGNIYNGDNILLLWFNHNLILHSDETQDIAKLIYDNEPGMLEDLELMMTSRTDENNLWFMSLVRNVSHTIDFSEARRTRPSKVMKYIPKGALKRLSGKWKSIRYDNSYSITLGILILVVLFSIYGVIKWALNKDQNTPTITTEQGVEVVTIDEIKKEINLFQELDATTSDEKARKYKEINDKLNFLKSQGKWIEDVNSLQKILQNKYYEWFNIVAIDSLGDLVGEFKTVYSFSESELKTIWNPLYLGYERWFYIGGDKWAIIKWINNDVKGTPVGYALANSMKWCTLDLPSTGLYCFDDKNSLYRITAWSVTEVSTVGEAVLPTDIRDIGTFGKSNVYLMINPQANGGIDLIKRYGIQAGNYNTLATMIGYKYQAPWSGSNDVFHNMVIDGNFLSRASDTQELYTFQRDPATNNLNHHIIPLRWGDNSFVTYSPNVKPYAFGNSRYVYLFDTDNNTFTVYNSNPIKTTQWNEMRYGLEYIMRYAFDSSLQIKDMSITNNSWQPILYVMTDTGIYETNLGATIALYANK